MAPISMRADAFMLCLVIIPPLLSIGLYINSNKYLSNNYLSLFTILLTFSWAKILKEVVYNHYFGPLKNVSMAPGGYFALGHAPYVAEPIQGEWVLRLLKQTNLQGRGMMRTAPLFHWGNQVVLTAPETFGDVLNTHCYDYIKPPKAGKFLERIIGHGLVVAELGEHKSQKKHIKPAFQGHIIKGLAHGMWQKSIEFAAVIAFNSKENFEVIDFCNFVDRVTLDIIGASAFGEDFQTLIGSGNEFAAVFKQLVDPTPDLTRYFVACVFLPKWLSTRLPMSGNRRLAIYGPRLRSICQEVINKKKAAIRDGSFGTENVLSILLKTPDLPDSEILDQMITVLSAGHDTTSSSVTFTIYLLATNPEIQERLRVELRTTLSQYRPEDLTYRVFDSLPFLNAVLNESLRLWPPLVSNPNMTGKILSLIDPLLQTMTSRIAIRETKIADVTIPIGTKVDLVPIATNRLEQIWGPDALEFKPERWLGEGVKTNGGSNHPQASLTFLGNGPRACLGQEFARNESRCLIASFVERFSFEMEDSKTKFAVASTITLQPLNGLHLRVEDLGSSLR